MCDIDASHTAHLPIREHSAKSTAISTNSAEFGLEINSHSHIDLRGKDLESIAIDCYWLALTGAVATIGGLKAKRDVVY